ncbi:endoplasmic reticulum junction formation protein lunapark-like [Penaeus chinensis]|uniref:endoplasmic reticulum junction formation protein lunapark-like n=1 Tax=Penaeus chinensis TaxID=139456 RepID=UPI001FB63644|nr:endoplasmic reticulum junction formation protein lunapark-like [Penaeus chinensis]
MSLLQLDLRRLSSVGTLMPVPQLDLGRLSSIETMMSLLNWTSDVSPQLDLVVLTSLVFVVCLVLHLVIIQLLSLLSTFSPQKNLGRMQLFLFFVTFDLCGFFLNFRSSSCNIYRSFIFPKLLSASLAWSSSLTLIQRRAIERLQRRATRIILAPSYPTYSKAIAPRQLLTIPNIHEQHFVRQQTAEQPSPPPSTASLGPPPRRPLPVGPSPSASLPVGPSPSASLPVGPSPSAPPLLQQTGSLQNPHGSLQEQLVKLINERSSNI